MEEFKLVRLVRTPHSEIYLIWERENRVGQVDLHFANGIVHATVILEESLSREKIEGLIEQLDEDIVSSYLPGFEREDFLVNVFAGEEILSYSEAEKDEDEEEEDDEF